MPSGVANPPAPGLLDRLIYLVSTRFGDTTAASFPILYRNDVPTLGTC